MDFPAIPQSEVRITADSIDPIYNSPVVEVDEERAEPVPHRYVHGRFEGTEARFSFYFPPAAQYEGRFFHNTYPMALVSDIGPFPIEFEVAMGDLGFTLDSGAFYVQTNNGGLFRVAGTDPAIAAYRVNAAAAKFAKAFAQQVYGPHKVYGYLFGGSGGAYQTQGAAENTSGVWDGFAPFVPGCDHAIPSMMSARMHALRVLRQRDRLPGIADAMEPGGSGDPYAGLNEEEAAAFREISRLGHPLRGWYNHAVMDSGYFANISGMMPLMDPTYAEDFWSKPGYLGTDAASSIGRDRAAVDTTVTGVSEGFPKTIEVAELPERDWRDAHLVVLSGAAAGTTLPIKDTHGKTVALIATADPAAAGVISPGDKVRVDNAWALALQTYHRHQVPATDDYYAWNQYRDGNGEPIYPQRDVLIGQTGTVNAAGSIFSGKVTAKTLMLSALMDVDAYAWQADWYRSKVKAALGDDFDDTFALYYFDNAHHENPMTSLQRTHVVSYGGALQQALRDLAAWVEKGVHPSDTVYRVEDTQVVVPEDAASRKGIQPTVTLAANGGVKAAVKVGEPVKFTATVETPSGAGKVVSAEWDFDGSGTFAQKSDVVPGETVSVTTEHVFTQPGTHFVALRVAAQREGRADTPYGRVQNIARARVVVS